MIKPINTSYGGYLFRSRLEARWAVFFDCFGWRYEYEKEGFILEDGSRYLPDFFLPEFQWYAEIKPEKFNDGEIYKCLQLDYPCLLLDGLPDTKYYGITCNTSFMSEDESGKMIHLKTVNSEICLDDCTVFLPEYLGGRSWEVWANYPYGNPDNVSVEYELAIKIARESRFEHGFPINECVKMTKSIIFAWREEYANKLHFPNEYRCHVLRQNPEIAKINYQNRMNSRNAVLNNTPDLPSYIVPPKSYEEF